MSRVIRNDHPWDESEIRYQADRGRFKEIEKNKRDFPPGSAPVVNDDDDDDETEVVSIDLGKGKTLELDADVFEFVRELDDDELVEELKARKLSTEGDSAKLKVQLAQAIQKEKDERNA